MSRSILSQSGQTARYLNEYLIDKVSDLQDLPKAPDIAYGSTATCLEDKHIYILDLNNEWRIYAVSGGGNGGGADGANCTISEIRPMPGEGIYVTFQWTSDEGVAKTQQICIPEGISITNVRIDESNHLICTLSDEREIDAGEIKLDEGGAIVLKFATNDDIDEIFKEA